MAWIALMLDLFFLVVAFGVRTVVQLRATDDTGWRLGRPGGAGEAFARLCLFAALVLLAVSLVNGFLGDDATTGAVAAAGIVVCVLAIVVVVVAQMQMGASWRIGVDSTERTALVTGGLYRWIRNPIYTGMVAFGAGQVLMLPSPWSLIALAALVAGVEIQVRAVEEPYLRDVHDGVFATWSAGAGRFVPGLGRI